MNQQTKGASIIKTKEQRMQQGRKKRKPRKKNLASQVADAQAGMGNALASNQPAICREVTVGASSIRL